MGKMLRKLVSSSIVFALSILGLLGANPAQAASTFSTPVTLSSDVNNTTSIPLGDDKELKIWRSSDDNGKYLKTGILHSDGTWTNLPDLATASTGSYFSLPDRSSWVIEKDGTIALSWVLTTTSVQNNLATTISASYIAYSKDGIDWSAAIQVFTPISQPGSTFECLEFHNCGFSPLKLSIDSTGTLTSFVTYSSVSGWSFLASTSRDGLNWGSPTVLDSGPGSGSLYDLNVTALSTGGFMVVWAYQGDVSSIKYSTLSPNNLGLWQRPAILGSADYLSGNIGLIQTDSNHLSLFNFTDQTIKPILHQRLYNITTKTWGASSTLLTTAEEWIGANFQISIGNNWHGAIGIGLARNGEQQGRAFLIELTNSVPTQPRLIKEVSEQGMNINAIRVNFDDSITMMTSAQSRRADIMTFKSGVQTSDVDVPNTEHTMYYDFNVTVSPSGNFFIVGTLYSSSDYAVEGIVYRSATAPIASGDLRITGLAKTGKQLISTVPTFTGVSTIGTTTIQWFSCSNKTSTVQTSIPLTCVAIPKANASKFKVTGKQKNKYLGVAVSNTNAVGTATLFSTLASKVK